MKGILVLGQLTSHGRQLISTHPPSLETLLFEGEGRFDRYEFISLLLPKKEAQWNKLLDLTVHRFRILALPTYASLHTSVYMPTQRLVQKSEEPYRQSDSIKHEDSEGPRRDLKHLTSELKLSTIAFILEADPHSSQSWRQYASQFFESVLTKLTATLMTEQRLAGYLSLIFQNLIIQRRKATLGSDDLSLEVRPQKKLVEEAHSFRQNMHKVYESKYQISLGLSGKIPHVIKFNERTSLLFNLSDLKPPLSSERISGNRTLTIFWESKSLSQLLKFSPYLSEQLKFFQLDQSIFEVAQAHHLNLESILNLASLLVEWNVAKSIEPLHSSSRFRINPKNPLKSVQASFQRKFHFEITEVLHLISEQMPLSLIHAQLEPRIQTSIISIIQWLLVHSVVVQEIAYIFCSAPSRFSLKVLREKKRSVSISPLLAEVAEADTPLEIKDTSSIYIEDFISQMSGQHNTALREVLSAVYPFCDGEHSLCELAREFEEHRGLIERVVRKLKPLLVIIYL